MCDRVPVSVLSVFPDLREDGLCLLRSLSRDEWGLPTACGTWSVFDVALHIAGGLLANVSRRRDHHPGNFLAFASSHADDEDRRFNETLNAWNEAWVVVARRISPPLLIEMIDLSWRELEAYFQTLDLSAMGDAVGWAGPDPAPVWLDVAREYTEFWTHLAQIREAIGRDAFSDSRLFAPVLQTFMFAVPHALRSIDRPPGTSLSVTLTGAAGGQWTVRMEDGWRLLPGSSTPTDAAVEMDQSVAWRLATKGLSPIDASRQAAIHGDRELGQAFFNLVAILG